MRNKFNKSEKADDEKSSISKRSSSTMELLERRWSAVSHSTAFKRSRKRSSCNISESPRSSSLSDISQQSKASNQTELKEDSVMESDYVKVSKTEYEEIKNRVLEIERRISIELENAQGNVEDNIDVTSNEVENVQSEYEKTLTHVGHLSHTTDQLAKQLGKDLKIRKHSDQRVFRSPSARKIGSLRRQSREHKNNAKLTRNQSWHVTTEPETVIPRVSLQRNTQNCSTHSGERKSRRTTRASSFQGTATPKNMQNSPMFCDITEKKSWVGGERFFNHPNLSNERNAFDGRASLAKLRSQNAGMVLAKAKLFDESVHLSSSNLVKSSGYRSFDALKDAENKTPILPLNSDIKALGKNSSPRKRKLSGKENDANYCINTAVTNNHVPFQNNVLKSYNRNEGLDVTGKSIIHNNGVPVIKKNYVKSPKRLHHTPKQMRACISRYATIEN